MSQHVFRPHPPNGPGPYNGPTSTSKHKKLHQLRSTNLISSPRQAQVAQPPQLAQEQEAIPPIHHPTNQASISVSKSVTTVTTVVPAPMSCSNRAILNKPSKANAANPNKTKNVNQEYRPIKIIGQGAFGVVYVARMPDGKFVAIKKVLQDPRYKNREYDILKMIDNKYCIRMLHSFKSRGNSKKRTNNNSKDVYLNIVMNYMPQSLHDFNYSYREKKHYPPIIMAKLFTYQIFLGLCYLHSPEVNITHRDMKPQNVLVDPDTGDLNICDFGSAKILSPKESSVSYIASRYYRAPELMMNCSYYTNKIDIWAAGCIFAEILTAGCPLFQGGTSMGQLYEIIKVIGQPNDEDLTFQYDLSDHELMKMRKIEQKTTLKNSLPSHTPPEAIELLTEIFQFNPDKRPSADECLRHRCFDELFKDGVTMPNKQPIPNLERPDKADN